MRHLNDVIRCCGVRNSALMFGEISHSRNRDRSSHTCVEGSPRKMKQLWTASSSLIGLQVITWWDSYLVGEHEVIE